MRRNEREKQSSHNERHTRSLARDVRIADSRIQEDSRGCEGASQVQHAHEDCEERETHEHEHDLVTTKLRERTHTPTREHTHAYLKATPTPTSEGRSKESQRQRCDAMRCEEKRTNTAIQGPTHERASDDAAAAKRAS